MTLDPKLNKVAQEFATKLAQEKQIRHSSNDQRPGQGENLAKSCSSNGNNWNVIVKPQNLSE